MAIISYFNCKFVFPLKTRILSKHSAKDVLLPHQCKPTQEKKCKIKYKVTDTWWFILGLA